VIEDGLSNWKSNINTSCKYLLVARVLRYFSLLNMKLQSQCKIQNTEPLSPLCYVDFPNCFYRFQFLSVQSSREVTLYSVCILLFGQHMFTSCDGTCTRLDRCTMHVAPHVHSLAGLASCDNTYKCLDT